MRPKALLNGEEKKISLKNNRQKVQKIIPDLCELWLLPFIRCSKHRQKNLTRGAPGQNIYTGV
jgi:hypothetical protein